MNEGVSSLGWKMKNRLWDYGIEIFKYEQILSWEGASPLLLIIRYANMRLYYFFRVSFLYFFISKLLLYKGSNAFLVWDGYWMEKDKRGLGKYLRNRNFKIILPSGFWGNAPGIAIESFQFKFIWCNFLHYELCHIPSPQKKLQPWDRDFSSI